MPTHDHPGDDWRSGHRRAPEIIAAERRILTYADGLLSWMRNAPHTDADARRIDGFLTHTSSSNPGLHPFTLTDLEAAYSGDTRKWYLEKMDPDANRLLFELLRAAWEYRCWRARFGEITQRELTE